MRMMTIVPLLILAACSESASENKAAEPAAAEAFAAGEWEVTTDIGRITPKDEGKPVLKPEKLVSRHCVGEGEGKKPPAALLAGLDKAECSYDNNYIARGRINANISCDREGLNGKIAASTTGTFTADSFSADAFLQTFLPGDGDVQANAKLSGRRVGDCPAAAKG